jgi:hypothetical protein
MLTAAGRLWLAGIGLDGRTFYAGQRRRRVPLPTYPFERERYWVDRAGPVYESFGALNGDHDVGDAEAPDPLGAEEASPSDGDCPDARTPLEAAIAKVWRSVLQIDRIGVHDDFFELGGTSVLIPPVLSRVNDVFQVDLPALTLLESPTIAELAKCVEAVYLLATGEEPA